MLKEVDIRQGDLLLDSKVDIICHQVNCQGVMGAGIAKQIRRCYPRVYEEYKRYCDRYHRNGMSPIGTCQIVYCDGSQTRRVANLFGQEHYGRSGVQTDYKMLELALNKMYLHIRSFYLRDDLTIGFPYLMGCDLAGGDWDTVLHLIRSELADYPGKVEIWRLNKT